MVVQTTDEIVSIRLPRRRPVSFFCVERILRSLQNVYPLYSTQNLLLIFVCLFPFFIDYKNRLLSIILVFSFTIKNLNLPNHFNVSLQFSLLFSRLADFVKYSFSWVIPSNRVSSIYFHSYRMDL